MKVFISGASGLLGSNCLHHFKEQGWEVTGTHLSFPTGDTVFFDTLHPGNPDNFDLRKFAPDVIVHCGALTHVDYCETHEAESFEKTVTSTANLVAMTKACNARFVFISTDYVFDGTQGPYREADAVNPLSIYGRHKLIAEELVRKEWEQHLILRVTNVYGREIREKNFIARIIAQCREGKNLTLTLPYDQFANPTNAYDIARAMFLLLRDQKSGVYHIGGSDYMNRVTLALKVLDYFPGARYELHPRATKDLNQPAIRPLLGGFVPLKFMEEYPDFVFGTIDTYLRQLTVADPAGCR